MTPTPPSSAPLRMTFDELIAHGRASGANIVNGMPWSFEIKTKRFTYAVTHENDRLYLVGQLRFTPGDTLVELSDGHLECRRAHTSPGDAREWPLVMADLLAERDALAARVRAMDLVIAAADSLFNDPLSSSRHARYRTMRNKLAAIDRALGGDK